MVVTTKNYDAKLVRYATYASVSVATILIILKLGTWWITNSISLLATLIDSILDVAASLINMFAVRRAQLPATAFYRFGYGKLEAIAALGQSLFISLSAMWLIYEATDRIVHPHVVENTLVGVIIMIIAIILTIFLIQFQSRVITQSNSTAIKADSLHYRSDLLINGGVIISLGITKFFNLHEFDAITGIIISIYILYTAWSIVKEAFYILMDRELPEDLREKIKKLALKQSEVKGIHELKTRSSGLKNFIQLHLELDGNITLNQAHAIADRVEKDILAELPQSEVIIHEDPRNLFEEHRLKTYEKP